MPLAQMASEAMRRVGAVGAANAIAQADLPRELQDSLQPLVEAGVIREGAPGTYYLHESGRWSRGRILKAISFWFLVIIIPVIILQLSNGR